MTVIGIVGLGQIGGSLALAARAAGHPVVAWDADPDACEQAADRGLTVSPDLSGAELVVLAVPLPALTDSLVNTLAAVRLSTAATLTDVGSLKQPVAAAMHAANLAGRYVGGHPMAGTHESGIRAAAVDLFSGARWALCLDDNGYGDDDAALQSWLQLAAVVTGLGAAVVPVTAAEHDSAMAMVSGVPHLLALALSSAAVDSGPLVRALAAGSFADLTRVAGSNPTLLRAITEGNSAAVRSALRLVLDQLDQPWEQLVSAGHTAKDVLRFDGEGPLGGQLPVSSSVELLSLGRTGAVIDAVDLDTGVVTWHQATRTR